MIYDRFQIIARTIRETIVEDEDTVAEAKLARLLEGGRLDPDCTVTLTCADQRLFGELSPGRVMTVAFFSDDEAARYGIARVQ